MSAVSFEHTGKCYPNGIRAVDDLCLDIAEGELVVLLGPSGCGKSTTLRMLAGLEAVTEGRILIGERCVNDLPPQERNIAMVFQNYALYPNMTVFENIAFSLRMRMTGRLFSARRKQEKQEIDEAVRRTADSLGITELLTRYPKELSGGQRQRVALGRCLIRHPAVFLLDEPLSSLDARMRTRMRLELRQLHQRLGATMLYVTHDQKEAMALGDRIVVMREGRVCQTGTPRDIYENPADRFVAAFIGDVPMNLLPGPSEGTLLGVRAENLILGGGDLTGTVDAVEPMGAESYLHVRTEHGVVAVRVPSDCPAQPGEAVSLGIGRHVVLPR